MYHVLCWFIILFRLLSVIFTFYSEFQTVITVQNRTHVYMNFFHHKDLGNHLLQLCPKVVKHPVVQGLMKHPVQLAPTTLSAPQKASYFSNCSYVLLWTRDQKKVLA